MAEPWSLAWANLSGPRWTSVAFAYKDGAAELVVTVGYVVDADCQYH